MSFSCRSSPWLALLRGLRLRPRANVTCLGQFRVQVGHAHERTAEEFDQWLIGFPLRRQHQSRRPSGGRGDVVRRVSPGPGRLLDWAPMPRSGNPAVTERLFQQIDVVEPLVRGQLQTEVAPVGSCQTGIVQAQQPIDLVRAVMQQPKRSPLVLFHIQARAAWSNDWSTPSRVQSIGRCPASRQERASLCEDLPCETQLTVRHIEPSAWRTWPSLR